jgi:hypothetical protein
MNIIVTFTTAGDLYFRNDNEAEAIAFLERFNQEYAAILNEYILLDWTYNTNLTEENSIPVVSFT